MKYLNVKQKKRLSNNTPENDMQYILKIVMKNTNRANNKENISHARVSVCISINEQETKCLTSFQSSLHRDKS